MDIEILLGLIVTTITIIGFVHNFLRNFKNDINGHIDRLDNRINLFEAKMNSMEERMFFMATGKKLEDAILEERMKKPRTDP